MTVLEPKVSPYLSIPYPDEDSDPFMDAFEGMVLTAEQVMFYNKMFGNMFMAGGGTRTWNPTTGLFTWTSNFTLIVPQWGKKITVSYGPDNLTRAANLQDGQCLVVAVPLALANNVARNFMVQSQLNAQEHDKFVCGTRFGTALYLRSIGELA